MIAPTKEQVPVEQEQTAGERPLRQLTVPHRPETTVTQPTPPESKVSDAEARQRLRKDRLVALVVLLVMTALFGFTIWLAMQSPVSHDPSIYEPWMMW